jgi:hypothetical protein
MIPSFFGRLLAIGCVLLLSAGCSGASSGGTGAIGGVGGTGGAGGGQCEEAAINDCLDLLDCCRAILINPVFFQSCESVALQCDQDRCLEVLAGYPQCAPEPEIDAGTPDGG